MKAVDDCYQFTTAGDEIDVLSPPGSGRFGYATSIQVLDACATLELVTASGGDTARVLTDVAAGWAGAIKVVKIGAGTTSGVRILVGWGGE